MSTDVPPPRQDQPDQRKPPAEPGSASPFQPPNGAPDASPWASGPAGAPTSPWTSPSSMEATSAYPAINPDNPYAAQQPGPPSAGVPPYGTQPYAGAPYGTPQGGPAQPSAQQYGTGQPGQFGPAPGYGAQQPGGAPPPGAYPPGAYPQGSYPMGTVPPGQQPWQGPGAPQPHSGPNTWGIIALVVAVIGLLMAAWDTTVAFSAIFLLAALILAIIAIVRHSRSKVLGIIALIVAIIGILVAVVTGAMMFGRAISNSFDPFIEQLESPAPDISPFFTPDPQETDLGGEPWDYEWVPGPAEGEPGSMSNPLAKGQTVTSNDWEVTVTGFTSDATQEVMADPLNPEPYDGYVYALVDVTYTYIGDSYGYTMEPTIAFYEPSSGEYSYTGAIAPNEIPFTELQPGESVSGSVAVEIPVGTQGLVTVTPGFYSGDFFVSVN